MQTVQPDWNSLAPKSWAADERDLPVSVRQRSSRFGMLAFRAAAGLVVVAASFWITLNILSYLGPQDKELRPTSWKTSGKASYDLRDGKVIMRGPNHIYVETDWDASEGEVEFSMFVERADVANVQFAFFNIRGAAISEPVVQDFSNVRGKVVSLRADAPLFTRKIQLLIYTPKDGEALAFSNPILRVKTAS